jgi:Fe-S oxidoreductase
MGVFKEKLKRLVEEELKKCIECNACLDACPLPISKEVDIKELNLITSGVGKPDGKILDFVLSCYLCQKCVAPCPEVLHRDQMTLWCKAGVVEKNDPQSGYQKMVRLRGKRLNLVEKARVVIHNLYKRPLINGLYKHVDKTHLKKSSTLFYFGCYIFSPTRICLDTLSIADSLGLEYEVIGGMRYCCGYPQYGTGDIEKGEQMHLDLLEAIKEVEPREVITGCAECYTALMKLQELQEVDFEALSTSQWIERNISKFPLKGLGKKVAFHDCCFFAHYGLEDKPRVLIGKVAEVREMKRSGKNTRCCGYFAGSYAKRHVEEVRRERVREAKELGAEELAVECITCWEMYNRYAEEYGVKITNPTRIIAEALQGNE